ncbi:MAG: type I DNA topoisomerase [Bacteroidales bacterium]|nr:type I DNA topoisomerase [Bacteroidales bacterium]
MEENNKNVVNNLVIVESPTKARTISKFLNKNFLIKSCNGHIRDLSEKKLSINIENNFEPIYEIIKGKEKIIKELKELTKKSKNVYLATDEDREGEAISWHLVETLGISEEKQKRIAFHEITKEAILKALENPRKININLVNAQQARRLLDRLVGYEISPLLWKKIKTNLSAGRVQSVAVRLVIEREKEIENFKPVEYYKVIGTFLYEENNKTYNIQAELEKTFNNKEEAINFLQICKNKSFIISNVEKTKVQIVPPPPFITSTLQQEASRKLGLTASQTMAIAQKLYETGQITYMRTDSVYLSDMALSTAKKEIEKLYGSDYYKGRVYQTKVKGAQEAHEAIRPTFFSKHTISGTQKEKDLYRLIWSRALASQMKEAVYDKTIITISSSDLPYNFKAVGKILVFDGFLKLYKELDDDSENNEDEQKLPDIKVNSVVSYLEIKAIQKFTAPSPRYSEATLIKKLEELGIGRPSTYATIMSTIQSRNYVIKKNIPQKTRDIEIYLLKDNKIEKKVITEKFGGEKLKLVPTDTGKIVTEYLLQKFPDILEYNFTAEIEKKLDEIAEGELNWVDLLKNFYNDFHKKVEIAEQDNERIIYNRFLGVDPKTGKNVYVKYSKYGPIVQLGESSTTEKPKFASLKKEQNMDSITLEEALRLFEFPKNVGKYEGNDVIINIGKYGPYISYKTKNYSVDKSCNINELTLDDCIKIIQNSDLKIEKIGNNEILKKFPEDNELFILKGRYGVFIRFKNKNYSIPKGTNWQNLSYNDVINIVKNKNK